MHANLNCHRPKILSSTAHYMEQRDKFDDLRPYMGFLVGSQRSQDCAGIGTPLSI